MKHLVVVAAGTGGHVMPGLAVADALSARGWSVSWLGTRTGMERRLVEPRGISFDAIDFSGLRGKGLRTLLTGGFSLLRALWQSRALLGRRKPDAVFSTGGYVAVPAGLAASTLGVPLVLLNPDAAPLLSTRILLPLTSALLCGFDGEAAQRARDKALVTGNPVRADIAALAPPAQRCASRQGPLSVLVLGGSLGAQALNEAIPRAIELLAPDSRPRIVHQSGERHFETVRAEYERAGVEAEVLAFIDDIAVRYASADIVICRAGAITVTELTVVGVASVLIPLVVSTTHHQRTNAEYMASRGAAIHLAQSDLTPERLAELLRGLTRSRILAMAEAARALGRPMATATVASVIEKVAA